ncbi:unnamed protein product [Cylindrotheca closterium]|uniref:Uncharacterized protein n=1 Tax=Cylindrotheca closterium TaxID=2856 RepID=A0AAD2CPG2_9STRA|nr:unnamed protein product [Cylindrotheca closterium]
MAQGNHKLGKSKKSPGSQKKKGGKAVKHKRKGSTKIENNKADIVTSKAINRKNERLVAAKAMNSGTNFFLKDIAERGKSEGQRQNAARDKKQSKPTKLSERLNVRLQKLR